MDTGVFATRSEIREHQNPKIDGTHIIGLDMGYSGPKCFHENGNFIFPNFCQKFEGELFGDLSRNEIIYEDLETGEKYTVGDMAVKDLSEESIVAEDSLFGRNHYLHPNFLITLRTALGLALWNIETDGSDIFIQTGLPPAYITKDEPYIRSVIQQRHHFSIIAGSGRRTFDITIEPDQVDVMYQPMGTFYSVVTDVNGKLTSYLKNFKNANMLVLDGGFGTLDKFVVQGKQLKTKGTDSNLGMKRVIEETRLLMQKDLQKQGYSVDISIPAMQNCLKTGVVSVNDVISLSVKEFPIESYLRQANETVREEAFESIKDYIFDIKYLIMTGGTGAAWCDYFKERLKGIKSLEVIPGDFNSNLPSFYSNARGYYMYKLNRFKLKG